jgi:indolepyruvate ferredoxin oxidoreductase
MDEATGRPAKTAFGPWMMTGFRLLARMKRLRGTRFDPFGRTAERRAERRLIADYRRRIESLLPGLNPGNLDTAVAIAALPATIRGFGPVKEAAMTAARAREAELAAEFESGGPALEAAAE